MGTISICDICGQIIKDNEKKFNLWLQDSYDENKLSQLGQAEMVKLYNKTVKSTEHKEFCGKCKKVLDYFFNIRKDTMTKILREIEKSYKGEELCDCINFEDRGLIMYGIANGVCYICGKKKELSEPLSADELKDLIKKEEGEKNETI